MVAHRLDQQHRQHETQTKSNDNTKFRAAQEAWSPSALTSGRFDGLTFEASTIPYADVFGGEVLHRTISLRRYLAHYGHVQEPSHNHVRTNKETKEAMKEEMPQKMPPPLIFSKIPSYSPLFVRAGIPPRDFVSTFIAELMRAISAKVFTSLEGCAKRTYTSLSTLELFIVVTSLFYPILSSK